MATISDTLTMGIVLSVILGSLFFYLYTRLLQVEKRISLTENMLGYIMGYEYPNELHANSKDTTYVNNKLFGKDKIVEFKKATDGAFTLVTEMAGEDGNDHKKAILRHTYTLKSNNYSVVKDVKFDGTDVWIKRNEYQFVKGNK